MFLDFRSNGQSLVATVGQQIEISLAAISGCEPVVSSPSIRLESVARMVAYPGLSDVLLHFPRGESGRGPGQDPDYRLFKPRLAGRTHICGKDSCGTI